MKKVQDAIEDVSVETCQSCIFFTPVTVIGFCSYEQTMKNMRVMKAACKEKN